MTKFFIGTMTTEIDDVDGKKQDVDKAVILHCAPTAERLKLTGLDKSPYVVAIFPLVEGPDYENQKNRAELLRDILNQHHELTSDVSSRILNTTKSSMESDALMRSVSAVSGNSRSPVL